MTIALITIGFLVLIVAVIAVHDLIQRKHAVTRNFPVIGHFRYFFEEMGNPFVNTSSLATSTNDRTTASPVHGCMPPQKVRTA